MERQRTRGWAQSSTISTSENSTKQEHIEEFLRKSLLGEELVNTQFHLFSARSSPSHRVLNPRVLCANNVFLAKSSKYFLDLLSSDINPSDSSLIDLTDDNDVPDHARIDDYGYASDSDLDDCNDPVVNAETTKEHSSAISPSTNKMGFGTHSKDDDESDDESISSDMFVMSPEQPRKHDPFSFTKDGPGPVTSSETAVQGARANKTSASNASMHLRSLGSRHVLVKDTAFQTWYTLLNYLYTDRFNFWPLGSATPSGQPHESSTSSLDEPRCSAKSMYRLACKVGLDDLRDEAFSYIRSNLTEHNILKEISCSLVSKHQELLDMELDVLYTHIASSSVVANFSALAQRIANRELSHGADIIIGIHTRLLKEPHPLPKAVPQRPTSYHGFGGNEENVDVKANDTFEDEEDEAEPSSPDKPGPLPGSAVPPSSGRKPFIMPTPQPVGPSSKPGPPPVSAVPPSPESMPPRPSFPRPVPSSVTPTATSGKEQPKGGGISGTAPKQPAFFFSSPAENAPKDNTAKPNVKRDFRLL